MNYVTGNPNFKAKPIFDIECFRNGTIYIVKMEATHALLNGVISHDLE